MFPEYTKETTEETSCSTSISAKISDSTKTGESKSTAKLPTKHESSSEFQAKGAYQCNRKCYILNI